jgi:superfamily I DNA/RNA helicase
MTCRTSNAATLDGLRPRGAVTIRTWILPAEALTEEQKHVVQLPTSNHQLVVGPAGSGKTILLLHRANYFADELGIAASGLRVLVYTNVLKSYINSGAEVIDLRPYVVQTFLSWVYELAAKNHIRLPDVRQLDERFPKILNTVAEHFEKQKLPPETEAALIDEGQDLSNEAYRLLARAASHVTVFADYAQQLYGHGTSCHEAARILGVHSPILLGRNLRNASAVMRLAAQFLPAEQRRTFLDDCGNAGGAITTRLPLIFRAPSATDEWDGLAAVALSEVKRSARVGILLPNNTMVHTVRLRLSDMGIAADEVLASQPSYADFNDLTPKVLTIYSAKGLSFDTVLIPRLTKQVWRSSPAPITKALFVGITRATEWVYLSTVMGLEPPELTCVDELIQEGQVIEKRGRFCSSTESAVSIADDFPL